MSNCYCYFHHDNLSIFILVKTRETHKQIFMNPHSLFIYFQPIMKMLVRLSICMYHLLPSLFMHYQRKVIILLSIQLADKDKWILFLWEHIFNRLGYFSSLFWLAKIQSPLQNTCYAQEFVKQHDHFFPIFWYLTWFAPLIISFIVKCSSQKTPCY